MNKLLILSLCFIANTPIAIAGNVVKVDDSTIAISETKNKTITDLRTELVKNQKKKLIYINEQKLYDPLIVDVDKIITEIITQLDTAKQLGVGDAQDPVPVEPEPPVNPPVDPPTDLVNP